VYANDSREIFGSIAAVQPVVLEQALRFRARITSPSAAVAQAISLQRRVSTRRSCGRDQLTPVRLPGPGGLLRQADNFRHVSHKVKCNPPLE
jgi:hypothetical protein